MITLEVVNANVKNIEKKVDNLIQNSEDTGKQITLTRLASNTNTVNLQNHMEAHKTTYIILGLITTAAAIVAGIIF